MTEPAPRGNRRVQPEPELPAAPQVELVAAPARQRGSGRWRWWVLGGVVTIAALLVGAWFALPIRVLSVSGNVRLPAARVLELAGLQRGFGWLYYGQWRARGLMDSPWVQSAVVTRRFPDTVTVAVTERRPAARWQQDDGKVVALAVDGTVMPGVQGLERLPLIQGWGPERLGDALKIMGALSGYNVQSVQYTPTGLSVKIGAGSVWSGDPDNFLKYAGSISMYPNKTINIYPWGVSVQE